MWFCPETQWAMSGQSAPVCPSAFVFLPLCYGEEQNLLWQQLHDCMKWERATLWFFSSSYSHNEKTKLSVFDVSVRGEVIKIIR